MKKNYIRMFLLIAVFAFAFTLASCGNDSNSIQLDFEKASYDLELGQTFTLEPVLKNAGEANYKFQWAVEDETVVECNEGELTAVSVGSTTVKVWLEGKKYIAATAVIDVYEIIGMPEVTFDVEGPAGLEGNLYIGDENKLVYEYSHQNPNVEMQFSSSNEKVATIDAEGNITALSKGNVVLTAKVVDKKNADQYLEYNFEYKVLNIYNITLNLEGGELEEEFETEFRADEEVITLPTPVKAGYNFLGWYGNKNFAGNAIETVDPSNAHDYLFYAKWEIAKYTITYTDTEETVEYTYFDEFDLPTRKATQTGWRFLGWAIVGENGEANEELDALITEIAYGTSGDLTLKPVFGEFMVRVAESFDTSKDYVLGMYQGSKKQTLYMTGTLSGYYGATTTAFASAGKINVIETNGGYYLKLTKTNGQVSYVSVVKSGTHNNLKFNTSPTTVWQYDEKYNTFTTNLQGTVLFLGTYGSNTSFGPSDYKQYITSPTNYIAHLYEEVLVTDQIRAEMALENVTVNKSLKEDYKLPSIENVTWELAEEYENAKIEDGVLKVVRPENGNGNAIVKLIATCTINKGVATKEFNIEILEDVAYEIVEVTEYEVGKAYKMGLFQGNVNKQLYANGKMNGYYGATTGNFDDAVDVKLVETTGGYYIQVLNGTTPKYLNIVVSGSYTNYKYENTAKSVWVLNTKYNTFTTKVGSTEYYAGAYKTFETLSASKLSYLSSAGNFAIHFYEKVAVGPVIVEESMNVYANKGKLANKIITWAGTDFTFRNEQYKSTSAIRTSDSSHFRCYASSKTVISGNDGAKIAKIVITTTGSSYATALKNSVNASLYTVAVSGSGSVVTITPKNGAVDFVEIVASAQWRLNKIVVTCEK